MYLDARIRSGEIEMAGPDGSRIAVLVYLDSDSGE